MGIWLGRKRIPPLPFETVLTDRSNGKTYRVARSRVNNDLPGVDEITGEIDRNRYRVYDAFTGPTVVDDQDRVFRLYVDSGNLGFDKGNPETAPWSQYRTQPVYVIDSRRPLVVQKVMIGPSRFTADDGPVFEEVT